MRPGRTRRFAVGALVVALAAAGCTGSGDAATPGASPAATPTSASSNQGGGSAPGVVTPLPADVGPDPLHPSVDDWPAGAVVVDVGDAQHPVGVRIADTPRRRAHGLMEVPDVPDGTGMWFSYPSDHDGGFWMRGTLTDIDIAWVDDSGTIVAMAQMTVCEQDPCEVWSPGVAYRSALEVGAGWFAARDVEVGDTIRLVDTTP